RGGVSTLRNYSTGNSTHPGPPARPVRRSTQARTTGTGSTTPASVGWDGPTTMTVSLTYPMMCSSGFWITGPKCFSQTTSAALPGLTTTGVGSTATGRFSGTWDLCSAPTTSRHRRCSSARNRRRATEVRFTRRSLQAPTGQRFFDDARGNGTAACRAPAGAGIGRPEIGTKPPRQDQLAGGEIRGSDRNSRVGVLRTPAHCDPLSSWKCQPWKGNGNERRRLVPHSCCEDLRQPAPARRRDPVWPGPARHLGGGCPGGRSGAVDGPEVGPGVSWAQLGFRVARHAEIGRAHV